MPGGWANSNRRRRLPPRWEPDFRAPTLRRDPTCTCPGCTSCTPNGCTRPSTDADHTGARDDHTQLAGKCNPCHQRKTITEREAARPRRQRPPEQHPGII